MDIRLGEPGLEGEFPIENFPPPKEGETLLGTYHTHAYEHGTEGNAHSWQDIYNLGQGNSGAFTIVEAGSDTFLLKVENDISALWFTRNADAVEAAWNAARMAAKGSIQQQFTQAVVQTVEGHGMALYRAVVK